MKRLLYLSIPGIILGGVQISCNNSGKKAEDSVKTALKMNDSIAIVDKKDAEFLVNVASGSMMEVELGKIAQANSSNERVKNLGNLLIKAHTRANEEIKSLASSRKVILPQSLGKAHQKHVDHLKNLKDNEFDFSYINIMVKDHKDDIRKFENASRTAKDADIKAFARETLPVLKVHLDSARAIREFLKPALDMDNIVIPP